MKKLLTLILLSMIAFNAIHAKITWTLSDDGTLTISGTGEMRNRPWSSQSKEIEKVVIENGVTKIGDKAFSHCERLTSITIPNSVTSIGDNAFSHCEFLHSITIPESVTSIGRAAFFFSGLISITIPESVKSIGKVAFGGDYLTSIIVKQGNKKYDSRNNCNAIIETESNTLVAGCKNTVIPNSVTSIGVGAFASCGYLTSITIPNSVTSIDSQAFDRCSELTSITIPESVTSIGSNAFEYCSSLTSITIPNSVTSIGRYAFIGTKWYNAQPDGLVYAGLVLYEYKGSMQANTNIVVKEDTKGIASYAFYGCSGLTSITIPNSVTSICSYAFDGCSGLTSITIPESVTSIAPYAFAYSGLTSIIVEQGNKKYDSRNNSNAIIETESNTLIAGCRNTVIPTSVTSIGDGAFHGCSGLTSVTIPNSVTSIGNVAFASCSDLTSIIIPNSVTSIGDAAFNGCSGLTSVTIPNSVTSIGDAAFNGCSGLTSIIVEQGNKKYDSRNNCNAIIETGSNTLISGCKNTVIPNSVISIGDYAFYGCSGLSSVTIPNSVTNIGEDAFSYCSGLISVTIPNSVTNIGEDAFYGCSGLSSVTIPKSVTSIGEDTFSNCSGLTSVTNLSKTPQEIYDYTFSEYGTLHVLPGCKSAYEVADEWKKFTIVEDATTGIDVVEGNSTISTDKIFSISGQRLNKTKNGVNIINGKKILVK